jgi:hypothetical protein
MLLILALQAPLGLPEDIVSAVNQFTDFLLRYVGALAAVGALSMAVIEILKKLLDARTRFQALCWTRWLMRAPFQTLVSAAKPAAQSAASPDAPDPAKAYAELLQLCTGVPRKEAEVEATRLLNARGHLPIWHAFVRARIPSRALFALDLDRMMGSIQEAADVALAAPRQHPSLYLLMTTGAEPEDVAGWYGAGETAMADVAKTEPTPKQRQQIKEHADRFARLRQIVKRKLDGFQLYTGDSWGSWNQLAANAFGIVAMFTVLMWMRAHSNSNSPDGWTILGFSLLGGILSPIAKDLVSALKRVKDG